MPSRGSPAASPTVTRVAGMPCRSRSNVTTASARARASAPRWSLAIGGRAASHSSSRARSSRSRSPGLPAARSASACVIRRRAFRSGNPRSAFTTPVRASSSARRSCSWSQRASVATTTPTSSTPRPGRPPSKAASCATCFCPSGVTAARPSSIPIGGGSSATSLSPDPTTMPTAFSGDVTAPTIALRSAPAITVPRAIVVPDWSTATGMSSLMLPPGSRSSASASESGMPKCSLNTVSPAAPFTLRRWSVSAVFVSYLPFPKATPVRTERLLPRPRL